MAGEFGLIFDVDGVIADTEGVNARATGMVFAELFGLSDVSREDFEAGIGRGAEAYVLAGAEANGLSLTESQLRHAVNARQENFLELLREEPLPPFPGVMELIREGMDDPACRLAIATSSTREKSEAVLQSAGIPYDQMVYITGDQVTRKKPDPELFLAAAEGLDLRPDQCLVIEDAPNGLAAARAAGCHCIAVTNTTTADHLQEADLVVDSLSKVRLKHVKKFIYG